MRVLYHHRTQGKAVEGVHIRGIADGLRREGFHVDVMSPPGADPYTSPKAMSPTQQARAYMRWIARLPQALFELAEVGYNVVTWWRVGRYLSRHPDVDFIYERYSLFLFATVLIARRRGVPVVLEVNDSASVERVRPLKLRKLAMRIERWVLKRADGLVFVSTRFHRHAAAVHGSLAPSIIAPNAANLSDFASTPEQRAAARDRLGLGSSIVCGYLGAFVPWHAIDVFVQKLAPRLREAPSLKLLLVGDGATHADVRRFVEQQGLSERIILAGRVAHSEVPGLLAAMDMAILPSAGDYTSPVKLFEFMAAGIPPIAPDLEPIREVMEEGVTGWTFAAYDMSAAVDAVLRRAREPASLPPVGAAAQAYVAEKRQWKNNVQQLIEFVRRVDRRRASWSSSTI